MGTNEEFGGLGDRLHAQDVIVRYAACIDDRDLTRYRGCFWPEIELHGFGAEPIRGIDAWIEFVVKALDRFRATQHMLGPPDVSLAGDHAELRNQAGYSRSIWQVNQLEIKK